MNPQELGIWTERRFFGLANRRTPKTPSWYKDVRPTGPAFDLRGVDAFARILINGRDRPVEVPLQIKSSMLGRVEYFRKHPWALREGVVVLDVGPNRTDEQVLAHLYAQLERVREKGLTYSDFFRWLIMRPLYSSAQQAHNRKTCMAHREAVMNRAP